MILAMLLLCVAFGAGKEGRAGFVECWIRAVIVWILVAFFSLEILSIWSLITLPALLTVWVTLDALVLVIIVHKLRRNGVFGVLGLWKGLFSRRNLRKPEIWLSVLGGGILVFLAIWTVPYNWDSMTYHLPRITSWAQNQSVAHYSTHDIRQLGSPVLAEFVNLHVYILSGESDLFFNLVQCFSAFGCMIMVFAIARKIGCGRAFSWLAVFLFYTSPSIFGEALSTQVDLFSAVWPLIFVYYCIDLLEDDYRFRFDRDTVYKCLIMALCLALGYAAKASVMVGMAVFAVALLVKSIRRKDSPAVIGGLVLCVLPVMIVILAPEIIRNIVTFDAISPSAIGQKQLIGTLNPLYVFVNGLKNYVYNWPNIYMYGSSYFMAAIVYRIAGILGVEIDAPSISEGGGLFYLHEAQTYAHDNAVNAVIIIFFTLCLLWGIYRFRKQENRTGKRYVILASAAFLAFCCVLRWEVFVSRYMISYFALLCPMIAYEMEDLKEGFRPHLRLMASGLLIFMCCVELMGLVSYHAQIAASESGDRFRGYFHNSWWVYYTDYNEICELIEKGEGTSLGLVLGGEAYEYPLWGRLHGKVDEIRHVMVENGSSRYEVADYIPDYIAAASDKGTSFVYHGATYRLHDKCYNNSQLWLYTLENGEV